MLSAPAAASLRGPSPPTLDELLDLIVLCGIGQLVELEPLLRPFLAGQHQELLEMQVVDVADALVVEHAGGDRRSAPVDDAVGLELEEPIGAGVLRQPEPLGGLGGECQIPSKLRRRIPSFESTSSIATAGARSTLIQPFVQNSGSSRIQ